MKLPDPDVKKKGDLAEGRVGFVIPEVGHVHHPRRMKVNHRSLGDGFRHGSSRSMGWVAATYLGFMAIMAKIVPDGGAKRGFLGNDAVVDGLFQWKGEVDACHVLHHEFHGRLVQIPGNDFIF
ncbi:MAG: hypothetical protein HQL51_07925 [Magnetococcales bacterium]|nr:hypothetical protein [Magnetococcales bacterium]